MRKRKKLLILLIPTTVVVAWLVMGLWPLVRFKESIRKTATTADRLVVDFNVVPPGNELHDKLQAMPKVTIEGGDKVMKFLSLVKFETPFLPGHCRCFGEMAFTFCRGSEELGTLTFHHERSFRWRSMDTGVSNFDLTDSSRVALTAWLDSNGGEVLRNAREEADRVWKRIRDQEMQEQERETKARSSSSSPG